MRKFMMSAAVIVAVSVTSCGEDKGDDKKDEGKEESSGPNMKQIASEFCDCAEAVDVTACMEEWEANYRDYEPTDEELKEFEEYTAGCQEEITNAMIDQTMDEEDMMKEDIESSMDADSDLDSFEANICDCMNLMSGLMAEAGDDPEKAKALQEEYADAMAECDQLSEEMSQEEMTKAMMDCQ